MSGSLSTPARPAPGPRVPGDLSPSCPRAFLAVLFPWQLSGPAPAELLRTEAVLAVGTNWNVLAIFSCCEGSLLTWRRYGTTSFQSTRHTLWSESLRTLRKLASLPLRGALRKCPSVPRFTVAGSETPHAFSGLIRGAVVFNQPEVMPTPGPALPAPASSPRAFLPGGGHPQPLPSALRGEKTWFSAEPGPHPDPDTVPPEPGPRADTTSLQVPI